MTEEKVRLLHEKQLAFFGTVTASLSHEINNVVAIVNELAGLLEDLLYASGQGRALDNDKLKDLSARLARQTSKGQEIIKRLNRFAHSVDDPVKQVDLREILLQITAIAERFAFLKNVSLEASFPDDAVLIETNPFLLQQAVFLCIQLALSAAQKNDVIKLSYDGRNADANLFLSGRPIIIGGETDAKAALLSILMEELGGRYEIAPVQDARYSIALLIPHSLPQR